MFRFSALSRLHRFSTACIASAHSRVLGSVTRRLRYRRGSLIGMAIFGSGAGRTTNFRFAYNSASCICHCDSRALEELWTVTERVIGTSVTGMGTLVRRMLRASRCTTLSHVNNLAGRACGMALRSNRRCIMHVPNRNARRVVIHRSRGIDARLTYSLNVSTPLLCFNSSNSGIANCVPSTVAVSSSALGRPGHVMRMTRVLGALRSYNISANIPFRMFSVTRDCRGVVVRGGIPVFSSCRRVGTTIVIVGGRVSRTYPTGGIPARGSPLYRG